MSSTFKGKHPRNIPSGYYKPIGQLIARWNFTELYLQSVVWHIWRIRDPKVARLARCGHTEDETYEFDIPIAKAQPMEADELGKCPECGAPVQMHLKRIPEVQ